jgi:hypothetical protein
MPRIAVARLWFEGNSFTPAVTPLEAFRAREWLAGPEGLAAAAGTATELGGLMRFLSTRPDWDARLIRATSAQPGGPMTRAALEVWLAEVEAGLRDGASWDGVYLSLHGAAVAEDEPAADLAILRRIRARVGVTPLVASFDFHANMAPEIATLLDGASVYRSYPHIDMAETAERALALLERRLAGTRLHGAIVKLPVVLHSFHMRSAAPGLPPGPMAEVWAEAAALEHEHTDVRAGVEPLLLRLGQPVGDEQVRRRLGRLAALDLDADAGAAGAMPPPKGSAPAAGAGAGPGAAPKGSVPGAGAGAATGAMPPPKGSAPGAGAAGVAVGVAPPVADFSVRASIVVGAFFGAATTRSPVRRLSPSAMEPGTTSTTEILFSTFFTVSLATMS